MVDVPDSAAAAEPEQAGLLDRAELAVRADVPAFVVDLVIDAGLLAPRGNGSEGECFGADDVEILAAARALVGEGVAIEEMAALAMRHVTNVENLIDDAIDLLKRHIKRDSPDRDALVASVNRLVPVATKLVVGHFERTLWARAMARVADEPCHRGRRRPRQDTTPRQARRPAGGVRLGRCRPPARRVAAAGPRRGLGGHRGGRGHRADGQ